MFLCFLMFASVYLLNYDSINGTHPEKRARHDVHQVPRTSRLQCSGEAAYLEKYMAKFEKEDNGIKEKVQYMLDNKMCLSLKHQSKFFMIKDKVLSWVKTQSKGEDLLYSPAGAKWFAIHMNGTNYAYRHILKCGGTLVHKLTSNKHTRSEELGNHKMFTAVRDPIDHFLSGWAECGFRSKNPDEDSSFAPNVDVNERIQNWLNRVKDNTPQDGNGVGCEKHSHPQANFLLYVDGRKSIDQRLELVGDLEEIHGLIDAVGFTKEDKLANMVVRGYSSNPDKVKMYPTDKSLLSEKTLLLICQFVVLDYYLFDFKPPDACIDKIETDMALIDKDVSIE